MLKRYSLQPNRWRMLWRFSVCDTNHRVDDLGARRAEASISARGVTSPPHSRPWHAHPSSECARGPGASLEIGHQAAAYAGSARWVRGNYYITKTQSFAIAFIFIVVVVVIATSDATTKIEVLVITFFAIFFSCIYNNKVLLYLYYLYHSFCGSERKSL